MKPKVNIDARTLCYKLLSLPFHIQVQIARELSVWKEEWLQIDEGAFGFLKAMIKEVVSKDKVNDLSLKVEREYFNCKL